MAVDSYGNAFICGLYRKKPVSLIENDMYMVLDHLREIHMEHIDIVQSNECSKCDMRPICKWCPAYAHIYNRNDSEKIKYFCDLANARVCAFG